ncbi:MAG: serine O-acetyltransferase [Actinomycetota bacterium]|nr:serine O-acetyltransferase [Actinomycetota bacterium]
MGDVVTTAPLRVMLREDWERHYRSWGRPGLHAIVVYRVGRWARTQPQPVRLLGTLLHRVLNVALIRNVYGTEVSVDAVIGRRVLIGHHQAVQIPAYCVIGDETVIRHNVTIGFGASDRNPDDVPHLGRHVKVGAGSVLMGRITIGDEAKIGPNCVVQSNVPARAVVFAPPARVMKPQPDQTSSAES